MKLKYENGDKEALNLTYNMSAMHSRKSEYKNPTTT